MNELLLGRAFKNFFFYVNEDINDISNLKDTYKIIIFYEDIQKIIFFPNLISKWALHTLVIQKIESI